MSKEGIMHDYIGDDIRWTYRDRFLDALLGRLGAEGYGIFRAICDDIQEVDSDWYFGEDQIAMLALRLKTTVENVKAVLNDSGLFKVKKEGGDLYYQRPF